jgi:hypothetical protein
MRVTIFCYNMGKYLSISGRQGVRTTNRHQLALPPDAQAHTLQIEAGGMPMTTLSAANRDTIVALIISSLRDLYEQNGIDADGDLSEDTCLIGRRAALDSLGLVTLIVDLEQKIEETFDIALTLANERAMSQKHSPFLTVGSLATYICTLLDEQRNA